MKFTHTADCHVGGHRDSRLRSLTEQAFERFISDSLKEKVDFIIIAGDLFNTAIPGIDTLKFVVTQLGRARAVNTPVYAIPGSHDFSPSGKTMLDVLEEAGLLINVCQGSVTEQGKLRLSFTTNKKTGVKLTGVIGKRGMLDRHIYDDLDQSIADEPGEKIFLFHTALTELKPQHLQEMESYSISFLPKNFTYYAGGHVHVVQRYQEKGYEYVIYPGPLFPNSFSELERLQHGGYVLYDHGKVEQRSIILKQVLPILLSCDQDATQANAQLQHIAQSTQVKDKIVLLRLQGTLSAGSTNDIDIRHAVQVMEEHGAYIVLRNTARLLSPEFAGIQLKPEDPQHVEDLLFAEHADQLALQGADGPALAKALLATLSREPHDGEKVYEYQDKIVEESLKLLEKF